VAVEGYAISKMMSTQPYVRAALKFT